MEDQDEIQQPEQIINHGQLDLTPTFSYSLNHRILANCAVSAILEPGGNDTLVAVTASNKVVIRETESSLHISDTIRCITTAPFCDGYDAIVIGTETQIIVFDIHNNATLFRRDIPDGVNCFAVGNVADMNPMIFCGGNCAIWGYDKEGNNVYWTVTGDVITCMCICDYDNDGENELIIGSPDFEIRVFKNDLMRSELMETDAVVCLQAVSQDCFGYALANGTIGVYQKEERLWRIKSKNNVSAILRYPSDELMTCVWKMGKIDMRQVDNGDVSSKDQSTSGQVVAACATHSEDPLKAHITVVLSDGKVQGYKLQQRKENNDKTQEMIREFGQKKHNLMMELSNYEQEEQMTEAEKEREQRIPIGTVVNCLYVVNSDERTLNLVLEASNNVTIRAVVIFAEGMFEGESHIWIPGKLEGNGDKATIPIVPEKDAQNDMHIKAFLGAPDAFKLHVFEMSRTVPRFARFALLPFQENWVEPTSYVEFESKQRLFDWVHESFVVDVNSPAFNLDAPQVELRFVGLAPRKNCQLSIKFDKQENKMRIYHDCIETTGNMVQSLAEYFQVHSLTSHASFKPLFDEAEEILGELDAMTDLRDRLTAELQEKQSAVKETLVRAEDSIGIDNIGMARKLYARLKQMDAAARQASLLRSNNQERCVQSLRRLNKIIENSSKLRVGEPGRQIVVACRQAISDDNKQIIVKILEFGASA
ncbi:unnamed protein product [Caenorhabditis auriculariae]|uniref:Bardet-Biedl syndrome 2 protein homolog n=1 Tax=Caenorhabditis auriculariae TaxID=2777116 RepID=A0A8S1HUV7_9PELO|nr:unnamed protein product [Caenorhabditis auriculariae]